MGAPHAHRHRRCFRVRVFVYVASDNNYVTPANWVLARNARARQFAGVSAEQQIVIFNKQTRRVAVEVGLPPPLFTRMPRRAANLICHVSPKRRPPRSLFIFHCGLTLKVCHFGFPVFHGLWFPVAIG